MPSLKDLKKKAEKVVSEVKEVAETKNLGERTKNAKKAGLDLAKGLGKTAKSAVVAAHSSKGSIGEKLKAAKDGAKDGAKKSGLSEKSQKVKDTTKSLGGGLTKVAKTGATSIKSKKSSIKQAQEIEEIVEAEELPSSRRSSTTSNASVKSTSSAGSQSDSAVGSDAPSSAGPSVSQTGDVDYSPSAPTQSLVDGQSTSSVATKAPGLKSTGKAFGKAIGNKVTSLFKKSNK